MGWDMVVLEVFRHFREPTPLPEREHRSGSFDADDVLFVDAESRTAVAVYMTGTRHDLVGKVGRLWKESKIHWKERNAREFLRGSCHFSTAISFEFSVTVVQ